MPQLQGQTAIVTGASAGFGAEIGRILAGEGARVVLTGRSEGPLNQLAEEIRAAGGQAEAVVHDLRQAGSLEGLVQRVAGEHGLDILVNNAGLGYGINVVGSTRDQWEAMFETNVLALLEGSLAAVEAFQAAGKPGVIVNISSVAGQRADTGVYGASKHAVNCITETLRKEVGKDGIRVVNVLPGAFSTSFARNMDPEVVKGFAAQAGLNTEVVPGEQIPPEVLRHLQQSLKPMLGDPREVAKVVLYAVTLPPEMNVAQIALRPQRDLPL